MAAFPALRNQYPSSTSHFNSWLATVRGMVFNAVIVSLKERKMTMAFGTACILSATLCTDGVFNHKQQKGMQRMLGRLENIKNKSIPTANPTEIENV